MRRPIQLTMAALVAGLITGGCSTPQPARDLAAQGALAVDQARTETTAFVERATRTYRAREAVVRDLAHGDIKDTSSADLRAWLAREAGFPPDGDRADRIKRIAAQSQSAREKLEADLAAQSQAIGATFGEAVTLPSAKLDTARKAFLVLAQELTPAEWLKFSTHYVRQLRTDIAALKAAAPASAPAAPAPAASAPSP